jgi:hypothetical protein
MIDMLAAFRSSSSSAQPPCLIDLFDCLHADRDCAVPHKRRGQQQAVEQGGFAKVYPGALLPPESSVCRQVILGAPVPFNLRLRINYQCVSRRLIARPDLQNDNTPT